MQRPFVLRCLIPLSVGALRAHSDGTPPPDSLRDRIITITGDATVTGKTAGVWVMDPIRFGPEE